MILTSEEIATKWIDQAFSTYDPSNKMYSAYLNDSGTASTLTQSLIASLGEGAQTNLANIITINTIIRKYINIDDLIGMVVQSIYNNINTEIRLAYRNFGEQRNKSKTLTKAQTIINDFNNQVKIEQFIRDSIINTYIEGNYASMLRNNNENWQIDPLPLHIIENSGYEDNGNPIILINIDNLKSALSKTMIKDKKGKYLFFKNVEEEVKATYPKEVADAVTAKEKYAVLDNRYTSMIRVNNYGRLYGLSPIFRALSPTLMLSTYQTADESSAKSKAKKIIHQIMRRESMGEKYDKKAFDDMAFAHSQLMSAWKNNTVIVTSPPCVEKIVYVEPETEDITPEKINIYRNKVLSSLGVAFLANDKSQTASTANINLSQLMKHINSIAEQTARAIERYYRFVLETNGIGAEYCPTVKIVDSALLDMDMRIDLSKLLYSSFGCSRETSFSLVGVDVEDERVKREKENSDNLDGIFTPYATSYNSSGDESTPGRPSDSTDEDKQVYDEQYNQTRN